MITSHQAALRYGNPNLENNMKSVSIRTVIQRSHDLTMLNAHIPELIYMNVDLVAPLAAALAEAQKTGVIGQIKTWDGCFNIRIKNHKAVGSYSLHSWGLAIDINAAWNRNGMPPTLSKELVACFKDNGFEWGGDWKTPDGMHFELSKLP